MNSISEESSLGKVQKSILILSSLILAIMLFFYRGGINEKAPLDQLARKSLNPEVALVNGRPTIIEFYADWCEACRQMAPTMLSIESKIDHQIDFVLLNIDNKLWQDLLEKYEVNGIPQLNFFDSQGNLSGKSLGVQSEKQLEELINFMLKGEEFPSVLDIGMSSGNRQFSDLNAHNEQTKLIPKPMSHG